MHIWSPSPRSGGAVVVEPGPGQLALVLQWRPHTRPLEYPRTSVSAHSRSRVCPCTSASARGAGRRRLEAINVIVVSQDLSEPRLHETFDGPVSPRKWEAMGELMPMLAKRWNVASEVTP